MMAARIHAAALRTAARRVLLLPLLAVSMIAFAVEMPRAPAISAQTVACGEDCNPTVGTPWNVGGSSNTRFAEFIPSGSETDAGLGAWCDSTSMSLSWDLNGFSGGVNSWTYNFQIGNAAGNLVDQQTGSLGDVIDNRGTNASVSSHVAIPRGGSASLNISISGDNGSVDAGALFKGVQTPAC
jgi:hypothetical protein